MYYKNMNSFIDFSKKSDHLFQVTTENTLTFFQLVISYPENINRLWRD